MKRVFIQGTKIGAARPFNDVQVKRYLSPETAETSFIDLHTFMEKLGTASDKFGSLSKERAKYYAFTKEVDVDLTEFLRRSNRRACSAEMTADKKAEIKRLLNRGTFKVMLKEELPYNDTILSGRFVSAY